MALDGEALICAFEFDAQGTARPLDPGTIQARDIGPEETASHADPARWRWIHLDRTADETRRWIDEESGLPELVAEALLDDETRPRVTRIGAGAMIILRGVNLNPGADPDDMISLRLWIDEHSVVSLRKRKIFAIQALRDEAERGGGPESVGAFVAQLADGLTSRLAETIETMEDRMDDMEEESLDRPGSLSRARVVDLRRDIVSYRRFLAPQREALAKVCSLPFSWIDAEIKVDIRETMEELSRVIDMLDSIRERAAILQENLAAQATEQMNRTMYVLSIVAAIFLPLGFVTGLLGINVGGMPGTNSASAFAIVCVMIVVLIAIQLFIFRRMRWF